MPYARHRSGNADQQDHQQRNDDGQRDLRVLARVVAKGHHAVAYCFNAGHGGAAGREDLQQQPRADHGCGRRQRGQWCDWVRMSTAGDRVKDAHGDHDQQRAREQVGGNHEHYAGVVHAAHVHDGENHQHAETKLQRMRLQAGHRGDERAHAGRNAHGRSEDVVDHERRRRQQARAFAQVLRGHGVRSAALGIRIDGLRGS